ncbi:MAG: hypothetical protein GX950_00605 [Candidatus Diapherotrites archaeon]|uniref:Uncharacterized protein n=1 Tax=Candidatus Iainarchaeum sp. TaxID=3101447 RepID=A0A7K4BYS9_9ARCH|nr:hypothetical protein [Candidatus Diapherotrites archaeon]
MLFSIFKIFLLKKEELDQPTNEFKNTHLSWALQVICPLNITLIGNIFAFAFGLILIISIGLNLIQRGQLNSNIINLNFILPMILVLITIEIIYLIIFLFLTNRSSKKIVSAANKFTAPLALLIILSFFMIDLKMSSILTIPILASLLFIFKFIVDIYYSFNLFN